MNADKTHFEFTGGAKSIARVECRGTPSKGYNFLTRSGSLKKCSVSGFGCKLYRYGIIVAAWSERCEIDEP
jgi:hypothetical protein